MSDRASSARPRGGAAPYQVWGANHEGAALEQMKNACALPVAVAGALMPDAHVGYGLPIGGVLATENAVIPYAVGVDIACRMKMTVLDLPVTALSDQQERLTAAIERETRFGVGATFKARRQHDVMDADWKASRRHRRSEGQGVEPARDERERQPLRRVRRAHRDRCGRRPAARRIPRAAQPLGQPRHGRDDRPALQQGGTSGASRAAARAVAPRLAGSVVRGGARILGGDGADGRLRGGESRAHPPARGASRSASTSASTSRTTTTSPGASGTSCRMAASAR